MKRKSSNAGEVTLEDFEELKEVFLADVKAEVLMNDIPIDLVFNWDQTGIQLVPDDKQQITGVLQLLLLESISPHS